MAHIALRDAIRVPVHNVPDIIWNEGCLITIAAIAAVLIAQLGRLYRDWEESDLLVRIIYRWSAATVLIFNNLSGRAQTLKYYEGIPSGIRTRVDRLTQIRSVCDKTQKVGLPALVAYGFVYDYNDGSPEAAVYGAWTLLGIALAAVIQRYISTSDEAIPMASRQLRQYLADPRLHREEQLNLVTEFERRHNFPPIPDWILPTVHDTMPVLGERAEKFDKDLQKREEFIRAHPELVEDLQRRTAELRRDQQQRVQAWAAEAHT